MSINKVVCIFILSGPLKDHKYFVKPDSPILIGRGDEATIDVSYDDFCSRKHAIIYWRNNVSFIEDLNSTNGTFVNNTRIYGKKELCNKDLIGLGDTKLVVLIGDYQKDGMEENSSKKYIMPGRAKRKGKIEVGDFIGDDFDIYRVLEGGMGIVYICYHNKNGNLYALKTIKEKNVYSKEMFKQEALNWINLEKHPHIVCAYTVQRFFAEIEYPSRLYIIMEYVPADKEGRNTLTHYFNQLTFVEILKIAVQFCYGMEYVYSKGIEAHRDIKPDNIMITPNMTVKITDFGLSKSFRTMAVEDKMVLGDMTSNLCVFRSVSGVICGTPPYMAPEQFNGYADKRSDIYSFGVVLYQLVKGGTLPFIGKTPYEYEKMHKHENISYSKSPLFPIIKKCLEKDPDKRYKNFSIIRENLQELLLKRTGEELMPPQIKELEQLDWFNKGYALDALKKYEEAIACYDKALRINQKDTAAWYWKGVALVMLGKDEEAIACYNRAIEINPKDADALNNKGASFSDLGKYNDALECFDKVLEINPRDDFAILEKIKALHKLGRYEDAIIWYDEVLGSDPTFVDMWWNKGQDLFSLGKYEEAVVCYDKALELNPQFLSCWLDKANAYHKLGKNKDAIFCCDKAIEYDDIGNSGWMNKGVIFLDVGEYHNAINCFDKALEINPESGNALHYKAVSLLKMDKFEKALECIEKLLNLDPLQIPEQSYQLKQLILKKLEK